MSSGHTITAYDGEGIRMAALELLEHSLTDKDAERQLHNIQPDDHVQAEKILSRMSLSLSPGYYDRALYLLWLKDRMDAGIVFSSITADEADGIAALAAARAEFERKHPPCPGCGQRLAFRSQPRCFNCRKELR